MRRATGFRPARASCGSTRSSPKSAREAGLPESADCVVTNPPFFDAGTVRASPDEGKARAHILAEAGLAYWIEASIAMLAPRGRFVMIHRPDALGAILAAIKGRLGALAILPVHPALGRKRPSPARFGGERLEGPLAPRAGTDPARGRRAPHGGSGRHPSRRAAHRLGRRRPAALLEFYARWTCTVLRATQSFQRLSLTFLQL